MNMRDWLISTFMLMSVLLTPFVPVVAITHVDANSRKWEEAKQ